MRKLLLFMILLNVFCVTAQTFTLRHPYSGSHYGFKKIDPSTLNNFVIGFNQMWSADIVEGFQQYDGGEFGQTFSTSGMRFVWGKKSVQWTASTDYSIGTGKSKNKVEFSNGIEQNLTVRYTSNQINNTFGVALKENKFWLEAMYCTNLSKLIVEYSTTHLNGVESFGSEYKLNGLYKGLIRTMEIGAQTSYRFNKRYVLYARVLFPMKVAGPSTSERGLINAQSVQSEPKDFPENYDTYVNDPEGHVSRKEGMNTTGIKGLS